jgi:hypothetical protein
MPLRSLSRATARAPMAAGAPVAVLLLAGFSAVNAAHAAPPVTIEADASAAVPTVLVRPAGKAEVTIPACRGVVWQRFDPAAQAYVAISVRPCGPTEIGAPLPAEGRSFPVDVSVSEGDVVRPVVVVGTGCLPELPFELARCKAVESVDGPTITVRGG